MFTVTVFTVTVSLLEILLFERRSVLRPAQPVPGSKRAKYLAKN